MIYSIGIHDYDVKLSPILLFSIIYIRFINLCGNFFEGSKIARDVQNLYFKYIKNHLMLMLYDR